MTKDKFNIYIEPLRQRETTEIDEVYSPDFLGVDDEDLSFTDEVRVHGEAYLAGEALILTFSIHAQGVIPCAICNEPVEVKIDIPSFSHAEPIEDLKAGVFNFREVLREAILLEVPLFVECESGQCPKRKELEKYLKPPRKGDEKNGDEGYRPFADLE